MGLLPSFLRVAQNVTLAHREKRVRVRPFTISLLWRRGRRSGVGAQIWVVRSAQLKHFNATHSTRNFIAVGSLQPEICRPAPMACPPRAVSCPPFTAWRRSLRGGAVAQPSHSHLALRDRERVGTSLGLMVRDGDL
jgi:hypothetical protein